MDEVSSRGSRGEMVLANTIDKCKGTICCQPLAPLAPLIYWHFGRMPGMVGSG